MTTPDPAALRDALATWVGPAWRQVQPTDVSNDPKISRVPHLESVFYAARWALDLIEGGALIITPDEMLLERIAAPIIEALYLLVDITVEPSTWDTAVDKAAAGVLDTLRDAKPDGAATQTDIRPLQPGSVYTCDWGDCDEVAVVERFEHENGVWLPVCEAHR